MSKFDVIQAVTDRIIEALEQGEIPWQKPWIGADGCVKHRDGKPYSLLNQLLLGKPGEYLSYKEATEAGGHVKKGAKSKMVVFWKFLTVAKKDEYGQPMTDKDGNEIINQVPMLRYYNVFHIDDCEGVKPKWAVAPFATKPIDKAEATLNDYAARAHVKLFRELGDRAFYRPRTHEIHLPLIEQFADVNEYYSTAFHEAVHSTGYHTLLNRFPVDAILSAFGSESYSKEELIAEIGACAILNRLGLETEGTFRNNTAYIQSWIKALKNDKNMLVSAAGKADKAVRLILNDKAVEDTEEEAA